MMLPEELKLEICQHLSILNLKALSFTSKTWYESCNTEILWNRLVKRDFLVEQKHSPDDTWKDTYKDLTRPVIILVTADNCSYNRTSRFLEDVQQLEIEFNINKLKFERVGDSLYHQSYPEPYYAKWGQLTKLIGWFPTIMVFTKKSWIQNTLLVGQVFNGHIQPDKTVVYTNNNEQYFNFENIAAWIRKFQVEQLACCN